MLINKIDYKGKWFVLQDLDIEDEYGMDFIIDQIESDNLTESELIEHIENCNYYGIPAYIGNNEKLIDRLKNEVLIVK